MRHNKELEIAEINSLRDEVLNMVTATKYTHQQKVAGLASLADRFLNVLDLPEGLEYYIEKGVICDLFEGKAPLRPRYICPNYAKLLNEGCEFLKLPPATNLVEALNTLLIFYHHVPSVTNFPVYIGGLDELLEPFVIKEDYAFAKEQLKWFLRHLDRTITDSFCHANLGPHTSKTGHIILELEEELEHSVPNMTFKYDPNISEDDIVERAIKTQLKVAKPSFANHQMFCKDLGGDDYCIASCYNGLKIGGGAYTLVRMRLGHLAELAESKKHFMEEVFPHAVSVMQAYIDERIRFIVEDSNFFTSNFLAREGFITRERFSAMFGLVGLAECVNTLLAKEGLKEERYGHTEYAKQLGLEIMDLLNELNNNHHNPYCEISANHFMLHGQVGIAEDTGVTPTTRIPIGEEPAHLGDHLRFQACFDPYFPSGTGEIIKVESTAKQNPLFIRDLIRGSFKLGCRYLSIHDSDSDVIRVTGYLAKRSDIEKFAKGESVLQDTTHLATGAAKNCRILERKNR